MYYLQSRYYDPSVCRFISSDEPFYTRDALNLLAYCYNEPVDFSDPLGTDCGVPERYKKKVKVIYASGYEHDANMIIRDSLIAFSGYKVISSKYSVSGSFESFKKAWNNSDNSDLLVVDTHGDYRALYDNKEKTLLTGHDTFSLKTITAKLVLLTGCNVGHYDKDNIARYLSMRVNGTVIASDGTVSVNVGRIKVTFNSSGDERWYKYTEPLKYPNGQYHYSTKTGENRRSQNYGWIKYKNGQKIPLMLDLKTFTLSTLITVLKRHKYY